MVLKRKRSDSEISTTSSILSSPLSSSNLMSVDSVQTPQTPSLFSSRTRKRHRDNRPDENAVHRMPPSLKVSETALTQSIEHTLSLLFSAQQNAQTQSQSQSQQSAFPSIHAQEPVSSLPSTQSSSQQSSLHSFWTIPNARQSSPMSNSSVSSYNNTPSASSPPAQYFQATNCEDCDANLVQGQDGDAMDVDVMMDVDMAGDGGNHACECCGKQVCHSCAVSNLGKERKCLMCAGKEKETKWQGGIGWVPRQDAFERSRACILVAGNKWGGQNGYAQSEESRAGGGVLPTSFRRSACC